MALSTAEADIEAQIGVVTDPLPANNADALSTDITPNPLPPPNHDLQVTYTNDPPNGNPPASQTAKNLEVQRDKNHGDPSDGLWSMYLTEAEKQDKEVTESWKGDTDGILVFTGLFSATVATFITESLQNLSPGPSDQTNVLLAQISQQLVNISNETPLTSAATQISQSFTPTPSAVRVNILWFLSLILSLSCALSATLMQQWARRYQELAQRRGAFHRRGRMRAYIFDGINRFKMARVVAAMLKLLHLSVFLFFAGVVDFLFPIYPTLAYATLGCIMIFALPYAILTVLPNIHLNCPYGTPLSSITWRISHLSVIIFLRIILEIRKFSSRTWSLASRQAHESEGLKKWREALENQVKIRRQWFSQGLLRSVELSAYRADSTVVTNALAWTLSALDEDKEIEDFTARVPGFFNSRVVPDATSAVLSLMSHEPTADPIFGSRLCDLLKTCLLETSVLDEKMRKNRLWICLNCLWHFGRAYNQPGIYEPLPSYFLNTLIPDITRRVQIEDDSGVGIMGHCFEALIVKKLAADLLDSRIGPIKDVELACLSAILGTKSHDTLYLSQPDTIALANMISFTFDKIGIMVPNKIPSDVTVLDMVQQTLDILSQPMSTLTTECAGLQFNQPIPIISGSNGKFESILLSRLYDLLKACLLATMPPRPERTSRLRLCLRGLWYFGRAFNLLGIDIPSDIYIAFLNSEVKLTQSHSDATVRMIGHCAMSLVVNKLAADIISRTLPINDAELACLSAILNTDSQGAIYVLSHPGAIQLARISLLMSNTIDDAIFWNPASNALSVIQQTFSILFQVLPAQFDAELRLDLTDTLMDMAKGSPPSDVLRNRVVGMFLKNLWHFTRLRIESGDSIPLPSYLYVSLTHAGITRFILEKGDITARVIRHCVGALIINNIATDINARTLPVNVAELECLAAVLDTTNQDVTILLSLSGAIQFVNIVCLIENVYEHPSWDASIAPDIVRQTFDILTQSLPAQLDAGIQLDLTDTLAEVSKVTSSRSHVMRSKVLSMFLKNLWHFTRSRIESGHPIPSYLYVSFSHPRVTRFILEKGDITAQEIRRCVGALIIHKLSIDISAHNLPISDAELECLTSILDATNQDVTNLAGCPGAVQLANMVFFMSDTAYDAVLRTPTSHVLDVVLQTLRFLSQALPAPLNAYMPRYLTHSLSDPSKGTAFSDVRRRVLGMFLKKLWRYTRSYIERRKPIPLPPYIYIAFTHAGVTRRLYGGDDITAQVTGRCIGALVVNKLVTDIKSGAILVSDAEIVCLSAILHSESRDVRLCLTQPEILVLVNIAFLGLGPVNSFKANDAPLDLRDVLQQTLGILSQADPPQESTEIHPDQAAVIAHISDDGPGYTIISRLRGFLATCMLDASTLAEEVRTSCLRLCLKTLWLLCKAYHRASDPLPHYFLLMFASPEMTHHFQTENDPVLRLTGCYFGALIASKSVDAVNLDVSLNPYLRGEERTCLSAILGTEIRNALLRPYELRIINLRNVVSLILGEIDTLFTDSEGIPVDTLRENLLLLDTTKVTLCILADRLRDSRFMPSCLSMDKRLLLQETYSDVEAAFGLHRSKHETVNALGRLQKKLEDFNLPRDC